MQLAWSCGLCAALAAVGLLLGASCGAMTLEPLPPEEPVPDAATGPPRLVRRDAGANPGDPTGDE